MIIFKKIRYQNFLSSGNIPIEIDLDKQKLKSFAKELYMEASE